jgi:uncharacterized membrane protein YphA (DoxX/SURF4 family)
MNKNLSWSLRIIAAIILLQTLYFKFTGAEESVYIFETLGMEPHGRIASGIAELIASILLLIPRTIWMGATLALGIISGALMAHVTKLGVVVKDDGGLLFGMAVMVFICCIILLYMNRKKIPIVKNLV